MRMALDVHPLDTNDHRMDWKLELEHEVWNREAVYEACVTWNPSNLLHVGKYRQIKRK